MKREEARKKEDRTPPEGIRLNKYLAEAGICSRRDADKLIEEGVVRINGEIPEMGRRVLPGDIVTCRGEAVGKRTQVLVLAYYKPVGVTCSEKDAHAERLVTKEIDYPVRVTYAGRLDRDSEGLLLLTNDGDLIEAMMRGSNAHEKEYVVKVGKELRPEALKRMEEGIYLKDLDVTTRPCKVELLGKNTFRIILTQGLNRQIRRMCKACGYEVKSLKRVRVLNITLGKLVPGEYREVKGEELRELLRSCGR
jgi:23S rRNA pseudouridine2604 synthase